MAGESDKNIKQNSYSFNSFWNNQPLKWQTWGLDQLQDLWSPVQKEDVEFLLKNC